MRTLAQVLGSALIVGCAGAATTPGSPADPWSTRPSLEGDWLLDASASQLVGVGPVPSWTLSIRHDGPRVHVVTRLGDEEDVSEFWTDGRPVTVPSSCCGELTITAGWRGGVLEREVTRQGLDQRDRWSLSDGGRTLTIVREITEGEGPPRILHLVFRRQPDR